MKKWYKLDNLGKFYASTTNSKIPKVFRYSAVLYDDIEPNILQEALNKTVKIHSNFNVNLRKGIFWYYLDETNKRNIVSSENLPICFRLYNNSDDFLYRVTYNKRKINFEVSHILSDGRGSIEFFKLLISNYIVIKYNLDFDTSKDNKSLLERTEDSYTKYYKKTSRSKKLKQKTYNYKGKKYKNQTRFMECHLDVKKVLKIAHDNKTTLTGLLIAVLIHSFKDELKESDMDKYVKITVPVDLRSYFKSCSTMNFFSLVTVSYKFKSKDDTLADIVREVNKQLEENLKKEKLSERVNLMVSFEKNWFCRSAPIFLKNLIINIGDKLTSSGCSTSLSNIGIIKLDSKIEDKIESMSVLSSTAGFQFTICTLKNDLSVGISNNFVYNDIIKRFCRFFSLNNIDMVIDVSEVE